MEWQALHAAGWWHEEHWLTELLAVDIQRGVAWMTWRIEAEVSLDCDEENDPSAPDHDGIANLFESPHDEWHTLQFPGL